MQQEGMVIAQYMLYAKLGLQTFTPQLVIQYSLYRASNGPEWKPFSVERPDRCHGHLRLKKDYIFT